MLRVVKRQRWQFRTPQSPLAFSDPFHILKEKHEEERERERKEMALSRLRGPARDLSRAPSLIRARLLSSSSSRSLSRYYISISLSLSLFLKLFVIYFSFFGIWLSLFWDYESCKSCESLPPNIVEFQL